MKKSKIRVKPIINYTIEQINKDQNTNNSNEKQIKSGHIIFGKSY